jgi:putative membrane protein
MKRASDHFTDADRRRIATAVAAAESVTAAEFVPVVATESGRYDRAEDVVGLWIGGIAALITWALLPDPGGFGGWGITPDWLEPVLIALALLLGFLVGTAVAARVRRLRGLFVPRSHMRTEVDAAAMATFYDRRVHHTERATGVLLYVSLFERMAAVFADQGVIDALRDGDQSDDAVLQGAIDAFTADLTDGDVAGALVARIESLAERLSARLPATEVDVDELPDALVIID